MRSPLPIPISLALLASALIATASRADVCVDPADSDCEATIQDGVFAAGPGEKVKVAPGVYREAISIPPGKDGLVLKGEGEDPDDTVIDGAFERAHGIRVQSPDVTIRNLKIRRALAYGVFIARQPEVLVRQVEIEAVGSDPDHGGVVGRGDGTILDEVEIRNGSNGAILRGDEIEIRDSRFSGLSMAGALIAGDDAVFEGNEFERIQFTSLAVEGENARVLDNEIEQTGGVGMLVDGLLPEIGENEINGAELGLVAVGSSPDVHANLVRNAIEVGMSIQCSPCSNGTAVDNTIESSGQDTALQLVGAGLVAEGFEVRDALGTGIQLNGDIALATTSVKGCGARPGPGVDLLQDGNVLEDVLVSDCNGDGFRIQGDFNVLRDTEAKKNGEDGFDLVSGEDNAIARSLAKKNTGIGFEVGATRTSLEDNEARENRDSFCDEGVDTFATGNDFPTTAPTCAQGD